MDRGASWAEVHGVARSQTRLNDFAFTFHFHALEKEKSTLSSLLLLEPVTCSPPGSFVMVVLYHWYRLGSSLLAHRAVQKQGQVDLGHGVPNLSPSITSVNTNHMWLMSA